LGLKKYLQSSQFIYINIRKISHIYNHFKRKVKRKIMLEKKETETQKEFEERLRNKIKEIDIDSHNKIREIINIIRDPEFGKINVLEELHQIRDVREKVYSIIHNHNKSKKIGYTLSYIIIDKTFKEVEIKKNRLEEDNF